MSQEKPIPSKLCLSPWVSIYMHPGGSIAPCCQNIHRVAETTGDLRQDINCEGLKKIRRQFLKNEVPKGCEVCFEEERIDRKSLRLKMQQRFPGENEYVKTTLEDGTLPDPRIKHLDIRWSNICNFKCRFCGYGLSSAWAADNIERYGVFNYRYDHLGIEKLIEAGEVLQTKVDFELFEQFIIPHLEAVDFLGGEPLLMEEFYRTLELLIKYKKV